MLDYPNYFFGKIRSSEPFLSNSRYLNDYNHFFFIFQRVSFMEDSKIDGIRLNSGSCGRGKGSSGKVRSSRCGFITLTKCQSNTQKKRLG